MLSYNTSISKRCYGNNTVKVMLYLLSFDDYNIYIFSATEKKLTDPIIDAVVV